MGGIIAGENFLGGNFPRVIHQGGVWMVGIFRVGVFLIHFFLSVITSTNFLFILTNMHKWLHHFYISIRKSWNENDTNSTKNDETDYPEYICGTN